MYSFRVNKQCCDFVIVRIVVVLSLLFLFPYHLCYNLNFDRQKKDRKSMKSVDALWRDTSKFRFFSFVLLFPSRFACFSPRITSQQTCQTQKRNNPVSQF